MNSTLSTVSLWCDHDTSLCISAWTTTQKAYLKHDFPLCNCGNYRNSRFFWAMWCTLVWDKIRPTLPIHVAMPDTDVACELRGPGRVLFTPNHEMGGPMSSRINTKRTGLCICDWMGSIRDRNWKAVLLISDDCALFSSNNSSIELWIRFCSTPAASCVTAPWSPQPPQHLHFSFVFTFALPSDMRYSTLLYIQTTDRSTPLIVWLWAVKDLAGCARPWRV